MKKGKETASTGREGRGGSSKTHKQPWQETYATPDEIKAMLDSRVSLRYNEVRGRPEIHWLSAGPVIGADEQGLLTIFGDDECATDGYASLTDRDVNTLWSALCQEKPVVKQHLQNVIESDYVPTYHPFRDYLDRLPPWTPEQGDHILGLSVTVNVKGDSDEQILFYQYLKKWLVGMVASWVSPRVVNNVMLILIGPQGTYKTTWFANLLPPQLRDYFYTKTDSALLTKDDRLVLAQYGLMCWEELDSMLPKELNKMKGTMTMPSVNERRAYGRYHESLPHLASFCGTGNNVQFLSDSTGTRRWLPFEVVNIESPLESPFDHDGIYAQAYTLYRQGFRYWFDRPEIEQLQRHNEAYTTSNDEEDLVAEYFRQPRGAETGEFMRTAVAKQLLSSPGMHLTTVALGRAFTHLGFKAATINHHRGYYVVRILPEERKQRAVALAYDAMKQSQTTNTDDTDGTDVF
jgi:hypothetical protein